MAYLCGFLDFVVLKKGHFFSVGAEICPLFPLFFILAWKKNICILERIENDLGFGHFFAPTLIFGEFLVAGFLFDEPFNGCAKIACPFMKREV